MIHFEIKKRKRSRIRTASTDTLPFIIGRSSHCDLVLHHESISREHCIIESIDEKIILRDNNSSHGLKLNHKEVKEATVTDGDVFRIGPYRITCFLKAKPKSAEKPLSIKPPVSSDEIERIEALQREIETIGLELKERDSEIQTLKTQLEEKQQSSQAKTNQLEQQLKDEQQKQLAFESDIKKLNTLLENERNISKAESDVAASLQVQLDETKKQLIRSSEHKEKLEAEISEFKQQITEELDKQDKSTNRISELETIIAKAQESWLENDRETLQTIKELKEELEIAQLTLKETEKQSILAINNRDEFKRCNQDLLATQTKLTDKCKLLMAQLNTARRDLEAMRKKPKSTSKELSASLNSANHETEYEEATIVELTPAELAAAKAAGAKIVELEIPAN